MAEMIAGVILSGATLFIAVEILDKYVEDE